MRTALLGIGAAVAAFTLAPGMTLAQEPTCGEEVRTVDANGAALHYFECGKGEPVVFVHGTRPVLLLTGEASIASLYLVTAELEECLEGEEHVMVPDAGHVMFTNRDFFDEALLGFLRDN